MNKKILTTILSLALVSCLVSGLTACGKKKTVCEKNGHSYSTEWSKDATEHWHKCANCDEISGKAVHVYDNDADTTCNVCDYARPAHTHTATSWTNNDTHHWHECTVNGCDEQLDKAEHVYDNDADTTCNVCDYARPAHTHTATSWTNNDTHHWHDCTVNGCDEQFDKGEHIWDEGTIITEATFTSDGKIKYTCTVCQKTRMETVSMEYINIYYAESSDEQIKVRFTVTEAGTYYFRYEVKNCGFVNGYYWINMKKVDGTLQQTDTNHAQAKIYDASKQLVKTGLQTYAAGQFNVVDFDYDTPQTIKGLMDNGIKYLEMPFVTPGEYEMYVTHYISNNYKALEYSSGSFSKDVTLWTGYNYFQLTLTDEMLDGGYYGTDFQFGASPATGLTWQFVDANGNPVEQQDGDSETYYSSPAPGTYYIIIYSETKQTGVTVSASLV